MTIPRCMVEEKVYYRYVGEHSQRQTHLGESRVLLTINHVGRGEGEGNRVEVMIRCRESKKWGLG